MVVLGNFSLFIDCESLYPRIFAPQAPLSSRSQPTKNEIHRTCPLYLNSRQILNRVSASKAAHRCLTRIVFIYASPSSRRRTALGLQTLSPSPNHSRLRGGPFRSCTQHVPTSMSTPSDSIGTRETIGRDDIPSPQARDGRSILFSDLNIGIYRGGSQWYTPRTSIANPPSYLRSGRRCGS